MKHKQLLCIAVATSLMMLSGCSNSQTPASASDVTPTKAAVTQTAPTQAATSTPAADSANTPADSNASGTEDPNVLVDPEDIEDPFIALLNKYTDQTLISLPSDDYQWNCEELITLLNAGKIVEIPSGYQLVSKFNDPMKISCDFTADKNNPDDYLKYSLTVNESTITNDASPLLNKIYLACLRSTGDYQIIIAEPGYTEDSLINIFNYDTANQELDLLGSIEGYITDIKINSDGTFSSTKRGRMLETWYYPQNYMISNSYYSYDYASDKSEYIPAVLAVMPPKMYTLGTQVKAKIDLPLLSSQTNSKIAGTVPAGTTLVLSACDDVEWVYVTTPGSTPYEDSVSGYLRLSGFDTFLINGKDIGCADAVDGLLFAD